MISIIVAIDSDGTVSRQDDITESLVLALPNDEDFIGFEQDSTDFQLYHYMFPPLRRENMGRYFIYSGNKANIYIPCIKMYSSYSEINEEQQIVIEVFITTEGNVYNYSYVHTT